MHAAFSCGLDQAPDDTVQYQRPMIEGAAASNPNGQKANALKDIGMCLDIDDASPYRQPAVEIKTEPTATDAFGGRIKGSEGFPIGQSLSAKMIIDGLPGNQVPPPVMVHHNGKGTGTMDEPDRPRAAKFEKVAANAQAKQKMEKGPGVLMGWPPKPHG